MMFKKAERKAAKLRAAICGTAGSGKTYSALLLARGLAGESGKIAVIDTERGSASLYSDIADFDVAELSPPYHPKRYRELISAAAREYDVLIIDSLSHAWAGDGGVLGMHDDAVALKKYGGNSYMAWRDVTPEHNALVDAILAAPCHVISTIRSKTAYEMQEDEKGKKTPVKIGLAPIQRDGMEYEFTLVLDVSVEKHIATASKDRTRLWDGRHEVISRQCGVELREWLGSGAKHSLDVIKATLKSHNTGKQLTDYWKHLAVTPDHMQFADIRDLFSEARLRIESAKKTETTAPAFGPDDIEPGIGEPATIDHEALEPIE